MLFVIGAAVFSITIAESFTQKDGAFPQEIIKIHQKHHKNGVRFEFTAFGQDYQAVAHSVRPPIHPKIRLIDGENKEFFAELEGSYAGHLKGNRSNRLLLTRLPGGEYLGYVRIGNEMLHFEPAGVRFPEKSGTLAYKESEISKKSSVLTAMTPPLTAPQTRSYREKRNHPFYEYTRSERSLLSLVNEKKNRCPLKIVADHRFFQVVGKGDRATSARYIMNTIAKVNEIFQVVNWDEDNEKRVENRGRFFNFGFSIKELKIWDKPSNELGHYNGNDTENGGRWSSSRILEAFTRLESSPKFCIVHLITAQSFSDRSSLGMAYVATEDNGGMCSETRQFGDRVGSYNTLITSVIGNSGKADYPLVTRQAEIVIAHEYGHSWGAFHDEPRLHEMTGINETCFPDFHGGGNYIMSQYAQAGYDPNNNRFSPCSVHMIRKMLQRRWNKCFEMEQNSLCGNGVVEEDEQCDEGALLPTSNGHSCCLRNCTLKSSAQCSPLNMPCCSSFCSFQNSSHICLPSDPWQCKSTSHCTGKSGECPPPLPIQDKTSCADGGECRDGNCVAYCERQEIGKKSCICEEMHLSCRRCCRDNSTDRCSPEEGASDLADGSWCATGYCKNSKCITEVADYVTYYLTAFQDGSTFWRIVRSNIVGLIVMISVPLWCLFSFQITKHDKKQLKALQDREIEVNYTIPPILPTKERTPALEDEELEFF